MKTENNITAKVAEATLLAMNFTTPAKGMEFRRFSADTNLYMFRLSDGRFGTAYNAKEEVALGLVSLHERVGKKIQMPDMTLNICTISLA